MSIRCVDCGFLGKKNYEDRTFAPLTEMQRLQLIESTRPIGETLACFLEADPFDPSRVNLTISCPVYMRRVPNASPQEHMEMQQVLDARREAQEARHEAIQETRAARASQRRDTWIIGGLTMIVVLAGSILAALIGRGILFG